MCSRSYRAYVSLYVSFHSSCITNNEWIVRTNRRSGVEFEDPIIEIRNYVLHLNWYWVHEHQFKRLAFVVIESTALEIFHVQILRFCWWCIRFQLNERISVMQQRLALVLTLTATECTELSSNGLSLLRAELSVYTSIYLGLGFRTSVRRVFSGKSTN